MSGEGDHATLVASTAASTHQTFAGIAPGPTINSAGIQGPDRQDDIEALVSAFNDGAEIINASYGWCVDSAQMDPIDWAFDYYARSRLRLFSVAAGNNDANCPSDYVDSPAKAWNVLSVGAYDDRNNSSWSEDVMAGFSAWMNPDSPSHDREKPEVVAPGVEIVGIGLNGNLILNPDFNSGTSFAAPQVAGLAALLIQRHADLRYWPEASRAIIMASAVHNIEGPSGIPSGQDLKDGAGGIDATLADLTAKTRWTSETSPCAGPCWWGISINNTGFPVGTYLYRYFNAVRGEHIRAAISWWANADCPSEGDCGYDRLDTDLQLGVKDPSGQWVPGAWSASWDNNYELVDFTAPASGQYTLAVDKERADEEFNYLGLAWVKDATYLPDLRNYNGMVSEIYVRNDGAQPRTVHINYFKDDGTPTPKGSDDCNLDLNEHCWIPVDQFDRIPSGQIGAAIVDGGEDVSVVVRTTGTNKTFGFNGLTETSDLGFQPGNPAYLSSWLRGYYGWSTYMRVQNTGGSSTQVTAHYFDLDGNEIATQNKTIAPGASKQFDPPSTVANNGSVALTANPPQPVVAAVVHWRETPPKRSSFVGFERGSTTLYLPQVLHNLANVWTSSFRVRNVSENQTAQVTIRYYNANGNQVHIESASIPPKGTREFWQGDDPYDQASAVISADQPVVANCNAETTTGNHQSHSGFIAGASALHLPIVERNASWNTDIIVQATTAGGATVVIDYYNANGTWRSSTAETPIPGYASLSFQSTIPAELSGSAVVRTTVGQVAVLVNQKRVGIVDGAWSYCGLD